MEALKFVVALIVLLLIVAVVVLSIRAKKKGNPPESIPDEPDVIPTEAKEEAPVKMTIKPSIKAETKEEEIRNCIYSERLKDIIEDDIPTRKTIRVTKMGFLMGSGVEFQRVNENILSRLFKFDRNGFYFYRWKLDMQNVSGLQLVHDENELERFSLLDLIQKRIDLKSIDFITYGQDNYQVTMATNVDANWWKFDKTVIFDPMDIGKISDFEKFFYDQEYIVSSDCLMTVLQDIKNTVFGTESMMHSVTYRADELSKPEAVEKLAAVKKALDVWILQKPASTGSSMNLGEKKDDPEVPIPTIPHEETMREIDFEKEGVPVDPIDNF